MNETVSELSGEAATGALEPAAHVVVAFSPDDAITAIGPFASRTEARRALSELERAWGGSGAYGRVAALRTADASRFYDGKFLVDYSDQVADQYGGTIEAHEVRVLGSFYPPLESES